MMDITLQSVVFILVALAMMVCSVLTVTTKSILRSVTYLLFVLIGTALFYFILDYTFLGSAQLIVYAGGIVVLFVFSILLTRSDKSLNVKIKPGKLIAALVASLAGGAVFLYCILSHGFFWQSAPSGEELDMRTIGFALMGDGKYEYLLPFEAVSVLLLACLIGGILIARKR